MNRHDHFSRLTCDWLMMMRCRRASNAVSRAVAISLRGLLTFADGHYSKGCLQCISEDARDRPKSGRAVSHHGPFLSRGVGNIAADQAAELNFRLSSRSLRAAHPTSLRGLPGNICRNASDSNS